MLHSRSPREVFDHDGVVCRRLTKLYGSGERWKHPLQGWAVQTQPRRPPLFPSIKLPRSARGVVDQRRSWYERAQNVEYYQGQLLCVGVFRGVRRVCRVVMRGVGARPERMLAHPRTHASSLHFHYVPHRRTRPPPPTSTTPSSTNLLIFLTVCSPFLLSTLCYPSLSSVILLHSVSTAVLFTHTVTHLRLFKTHPHTPPPSSPAVFPAQLLPLS